MPPSVNRKKTVVYSVVIILILIFGVIFPAYHVYNHLFRANPTIIVHDGYYNATYSGNFARITENYNIFTFPTNISRALVMMAGQPNSTLDISAINGNILYNSADNQAVLTFNLSVEGHFISKLHPRSLSISVGAVGQHFILITWAPPYSTAIPVADNLSPNNLGDLRLGGPGNVSVTTNLLNQSNSVPFYNFYFSVMVTANLLWQPVNSHTFDFSAQVNGLSKPVNSTLSMTIVEAN